MTEFIKSATKKSLLAIVKEPLTPRSWARLFEALVTKDELQDYVASVVDDSVANLSGTDTTASNIGSGEDIFDGKVGTDLQFRGIKSLNSYLVTGYSGATKDITLQVLPGNMDHGGFAGLDDDDHQHYSLADGTRAFTGDVAIESAADPTLTLAEGGSGTYHSKFYDVDVNLHIDKSTGGGPATIYIDPLSGSVGGNNHIAFFRYSDTTLYGGNSEITIFKGDGTANTQHQFVGSNGYVDLCRAAGNLTVGGTAGSKKLNVVGDTSVSTELYVGGNLLLTLATTEPADGVLDNGEAVFWME